MREQEEGNQELIVELLQQKVDFLQEAYDKLLAEISREKTVINDMPLAKFTLDADSAIIGVNKGFKKLLGYSKDEFLKMKFEDLLVEGYTKHKALFEEFKQVGIVKNLAWKMKKKHGGSAIVRITGRGVYNKDGSFKYGRGFGLDITEQVRATQALRRSEKEKQQILDVMSDSVLYFDTDMRVIWANRKASELSGIPVEDLTGKFCHDICQKKEGFCPDCPTGEKKKFEKMLEGEIRVRGLTYYIMSIPIFDENNDHVGIVQIKRDITEKKALEKRLLETSTKERKKIGNDIHDGLGQALAGISFLSTTLSKKLAGLDDSSAHIADEIVNHSKKALNLMRSIINGLCPVVEDPKGLMSALDQISIDIQNVFGIPVQFYCPDPVRIDDYQLASHLFFIAQEAVTNAVKHSNCTSIEVSLTEEEPEMLVLTIKDNGVGIPPDSENGKGMGLKLMKYRATMINGDFSYKSNEKDGTTISMKIRNSSSREEIIR